MKKSASPKLLLRPCLLLWAASASVYPVPAGTTTVINNNDNGARSLRQAIQDAASGDTINFSVNGTITLTSGELLIDKDLNIVGPGAAILAVSGNHASRVFEISGATVAISGLTICGGQASNFTNAPYINGGGIYNGGMLALTACMLSSNAAGAGLGGITDVGQNGGRGGGIQNEGTLTLVGCTLNENTGGNGGRGGGGMFGGRGYAGGVGGPGGGVFNQGVMAVTACTFSGNAGGTGGTGGFSSESLGGRGGLGGPGGAIYNGTGASITVTACTFSYNRAGAGGQGGGSLLGGGTGGQGGNGGSGGGIENAADALSATLRNVLVTPNLVGARGYGGYPGGTVGSFGVSPDLLGSFTSEGHNMIGQTNGSSGFADGINGDIIWPYTPFLGPLQDNGGPTWTIALLPGGLAIDAGDDALLAPPFNLATDQRGQPRKSGAHVDIGAFEFQTPPFLTGPTMVGDGTFRFTVIGEAGRSYTIQASTDLVGWTTLTNFTSATGTNQLTDPSASNLTGRFYRAVMQ